jgi:hypothetical protein
VAAAAAVAVVEAVVRVGEARSKSRTVAEAVNPGAAASREARAGGEPPRGLPLGPGGYRSPRQRVPLNSRHEGSGCVGRSGQKYMSGPTAASTAWWGTAAPAPVPVPAAATTPRAG